MLFFFILVFAKDSARAKRLRPAGSDPEVVCQKNSFLKVSVSLGGFGPSVAHGKHSVRRRCVQATKNKAENCSLRKSRNWLRTLHSIKESVFEGHWFWIPSPTLGSLPAGLNKETRSRYSTLIPHILRFRRILKNLTFPHSASSEYCQERGVGYRKQIHCVERGGGGGGYGTWQCSGCRLELWLTQPGRMHQGVLRA